MDQAFFRALEKHVRAAGAELLRRWPGNTNAALKIATKSDGSPVTDADLKSHEIIMAALSELAPGEMVVSEESAPSDGRQLPASCWFVDPLDGTKPFIKGDDHFAVFVGHKTGLRFDFGMMYFPARNNLIVGGVNFPATCNGKPLSPNRSREINFGAVVLHYANAEVPPQWLSAAKYPSRTLAYLDVCSGVLDAAIGSYTNAVVELWDIAATLAILQSLNISAVNYDGSSPQIRGTQLITPGLVVTTPDKLEVVLRGLGNIQLT